MANRGFTLIEVMISVGIFGVVMGSMVPVFLSYVRYNSQSELRTAAILASARTLDELRLQDPHNLPSSGHTGPIDVAVDGRTFQVITFYCENATFCASANNRHLRAQVNYKNIEIYNVETVFTQLR